MFVTFFTFLFHSSPPTRTFTVFAASPADTTTPVAARENRPGADLTTTSAAVVRAAEAIGIWTGRDKREIPFLSGLQRAWKMWSPSKVVAGYRYSSRKQAKRSDSRSANSPRHAHRLRSRP